MNKAVAKALEIVNKGKSLPIVFLSSACHLYFCFPLGDNDFKLIYYNWQFAFDTSPFIKKKPIINSLYFFKTVIRPVNRSFIALKRICEKGMTPFSLHFIVLFTISLNPHIITA